MAMSVVYATVNSRLVQENRGGSVIQTRDGARNQTFSTTYWPFGEVRTQTGTNPSPWGFCGIGGCYKDTLVRLYVRARSLRANLPRWLTVYSYWPVEMAYAYVKEQPITAANPSASEDGIPINAKM